MNEMFLFALSTGTMTYFSLRCSNSFTAMGSFKVGRAIFQALYRFLQLLT